MNPHERLKHHVTGAIERGEATPVTEIPVPEGAKAVADSFYRAMMEAGRAKGAAKAIEQDILAREYSGARSHIEIMRRKLQSLDELLRALERE